MTSSPTPVRVTLDPSEADRLQSLLKFSAPPEPHGFAEFWRSTYDQTLAVAPDVARRLCAFSTNETKVYEVDFNSFGDIRIGGWLTVPVHESIKQGVVCGHGYDGRPEPSLDTPYPSAAVLYPCARGFHRSAQRNIPRASNDHVIHGIESKETYIHRGCAADIWSAASALLELLPEVAGNLQYHGSSFGGGIGALALPWDRRFTRAYLDVPSFGNHPVRLQIKCTGSGESVRRHYEKHPEIAGVLRYFDSAIAAQYMECPTFVSAALRDPAVPPPGQFSVYNSLRCENALFVRTTGHPNTPEDELRLDVELNKWFNQPQAR